jgi:hypothetical protein
VEEREGSIVGIKLQTLVLLAAEWVTTNTRQVLKKRNHMEFKAKLVWSRISTPMPRDI